MTNTEIKHYKVLSLPEVPKPSVVYYVLDSATGKVETFITNINGVPIPLIDLVSQGIISVTGTAVTDGGTLNPKVDISTFINLQEGNRIEIAQDGKLLVIPIINEDGSLTLTENDSKIDIKISEEFKEELLGNKLLNKVSGETIPSYTPIAIIDNLAYKLDSSNINHQLKEYTS